ncbi:methyltransferase [Fusarium denticulatum]|uniref:Methyltransferase n=1 Tax=Fusarium denticulatum TaxID=48507 RepID=A0A8H5XCE3_9HYPO|nr:methyltransferase [Fusarium denticulatum]
MSSPARKKHVESSPTGSTPPRVDPTFATIARGEFCNAFGILSLTRPVPKEEMAPEDSDSAVLDNASSTASLTSSILLYRTINGRAYQSERGSPEYWGPIDDTGQEAMDINYHVLSLMLGDKLYLTPVPDDIQTAVDIETGTGKLKTALRSGPNTFDYIHMRWLVGGIADWKCLFKEAYKCLKPAGYIESYEPSCRVESDDGTVLPGTALSQWKKFFVEGGRKMGRPFTIFEENIQRQGMREAGFLNMEERDFKNPGGGWPKDPKQRSVGQFKQAAFEQDAQGTVLHKGTEYSVATPSVP